jgi:hypothetical protein
MHWIIFLQPSEVFFYFAFCAMGVGMPSFRGGSRNRDSDEKPPNI